MYVMITGASRGIGLALAREALDKGYHVLALARAPQDSPELTKLAESKKLTILQGDLSQSDIENKISHAVKSWPSLDLIINNAGIYEEDESVENFQKSFLINTIKPLLVTKALKSQLKQSKLPKAVFITSQMGSIADNQSGGSYSYRASKAALNMVVKSLAIDEKWLASLLIHPGWVQTRMGGEQAPTKPEESAKGIWKIIENSDLSDSGSFQDFRGKILPW